MNKRKVIFNGITLSTQNKVTGIQRYCREILLRLDKIIGREFIAEYLYLENSSNDVIKLNEFKNITPVKISNSKHKLFINLKTIPQYLKNNKDALCINMMPEAINNKNQIVTIHDLRPVLFKGDDSFKTKLKYKLNLSLAKKKSLLIITDSIYQKNSICSYLKLKESQVDVIYAGWEHVNEVIPDNSIFSKFDNREYFYALGSVAPNKNYKWIIETAKNNQDKVFVIAGEKHAINKNFDIGYIPKNVIFLGYVTDEQNKALMQKCKAFLFPSKYEGFGIPPLEALACGTQIIISNATCLPEIYEDCAHYINPDNFNVNLDALLEEPVANSKKVLKKCSWDVAAGKWYELIKSII